MEIGEQSDYGSTWYAATAALPAPRTPLNYDLDVDVCIIGGGLAGLTAAREVARRGWSVAILEARRVAWNASGRNSGVVLPGFSAPAEKVVERIGIPATKALWELSQSGVQYIRDAIAEMGDIGVVEGDGWLDVLKWPDRDRVAARVRLLEEMGVEVEAWPTERVRDTLQTRHYFDAVHFPRGFHINPLVYAQRLADAAQQAGVRIFENTRVTAVDLVGIRKRINTPGGRVRAGHLVLAGNIHLAGITSDLADTLIPMTAFTGVTQPLGGQRLAHAVRFEGAVSCARDAGHHYRIVGQDRLLWTGAAAGGPALGRRLLEAAIRATYPQLGAVQFEYFWPAHTGFAVHRMPQIGEVERGVWLASAFGAQGLNTSAMAGDLIARAIVEGDDRWRHFQPFELVWAGGRVGRTVAWATAWWRRQSGVVRALAARQHEDLQRRRQEKRLKADLAGNPRGKIRGREILGLRLTVPSRFNPMPALKRTLKNSFTADDRPIDAPETVPDAGTDDRGPGGATRHSPLAARD
jgi:gamma-glutamylputrescine oxidase